MNLKTKSFQGAKFKAESDDTGYFEIVFSTFNVVDRDKEVVAPGAIPSVELPLIVAHDWTKLPVGKGTISSDHEKATFKGNFFLETEHGKQAYLTAKAMGDIQQYSWAFDVLDNEKGVIADQTVNIIKKTEPFEVTMALVGVNRQTYTSVLKGLDSKMYVDAQMTGSYEELSSALCDAFRVQQFGGDRYEGSVYVVATYADRFVGMIWRWSDDEESYWEVPYGKDSSGGIVLGTPVQVEAKTEFVPVGKGMNFDEHVSYVQVAVGELVKRGKAGAATRRKEGRAISSARRERLLGVVTWLQDAAKEVQNLLDETEPSSDDDSTKAQALKQRALLLKLQAQALGVD